jgi:hypothetical protein
VTGKGRAYPRTTVAIVLQHPRTPVKLPRLKLRARKAKTNRVGRGLLDPVARGAEREIGERRTCETSGELKAFSTICTGRQRLRAAR